MRARIVIGVLVAVLVIGGVVLWKMRARTAKKTTGTAPVVTMPVHRLLGEPGMRAVREADPAGKMRLEGQVIDAAEKPVAGALITIDTNPPRKVRSQGDGSFAFDELLPRGYAIVAQHSAGYAGPVRTRLTAKSEPVIMRLRPGGELRVSVVDAAGGKAIPGASVMLRMLARHEATAGEDGVAILRRVGRGWGSLRASAPGFASAAIMVDARGEGVERHVIELAKGAAVSGRVLDASGAPVVGAKVIADPTNEPFPVVDPEQDSVVTDTAGRWRIEAVAAGSYRFIARSKQHAPGATAPISLDGTHPRADIEITLTAGAVLRGKVQTSRGAPLGSATVRISEKGGGFFWHLTREASTNEHGELLVHGLRRVEHRLVAVTNLGSSPVTDVDLSKGNGEVALTISVSGSITGQVVGSDGQPVAEAQVMAEPVWSGQLGERADWRIRGLPQRVSDGGGRFRLVGLPIGKYTLRAAHPGATGSAVWNHQGVVAKVGDESVELSLLADGAVRGRIAFKDGTVPKSFTVAIGNGQPRPSARPDGSFTVRGTGGKQNLNIAGSGFMRKTVPVDILPGGIDVGTITVERGRSISGRVVDQDGRPVAGAKVAVGSLLTGGGAELHIPSESIGAHESKTGEQGRFSFTGLPDRSMVLVAGHPERGRAESVSVSASNRSVELELVLRATGKVAGIVRRGGKPLPSTVIIANPRQAMSSNFFVMSGPDGSYTFDRLTAGEYTIMVMIGAGGSKPKDMTFRAVTVEAGKRSTRDVDVPHGPVRLDVVAQTDAGKPVPMAQLLVLNGEHDAPNMDALRERAAEVAKGSLYLRFIMGAPARIERLTAGVYTACLLPVPAKPGDMAAVGRLMQQAGTLPMKCKSSTIPARPTSQTLTVQVPAAWIEPR